MRLTHLALLFALCVSEPVAAGWKQGMDAFSRHDYATAIQEFDAYTRANPGSGRAYYMLGRSQDMAGLTILAADSARKAVQLDGSETSYRVFLGEALVKSEQYSEGYCTLKEVSLSSVAVESRSQYALAFARAAIESGHASDAIPVLSIQAEADSSNAWLGLYLSRCYVSEKDYDTAMNVLQGALENGVSGDLRTQIYNQLGYVLRKKRDYRAAKQAYVAAGNQVKAEEMQNSIELSQRGLTKNREAKELERKKQILSRFIQELRQAGENEEADRLQRILDEMPKTPEESD